MKDCVKDYAVNSARWLSIEDFEGEVWRDVKDFEGIYKVSNYGRIKTVYREIPLRQPVYEHIMKSSDNGRGYLFVNLSIDNKKKRMYIHRLVGIAFIPNPQKLPQINHKDENKGNNVVSNLEWCNNEYNSKYGTARKRGKETLFSNGNNRAIDVYTLKGEFIKRYDFAYDLDKEGLSRRNIYNVCKHRARSYKGFVYRFEGEPFTYRETNYNRGVKKGVWVSDNTGEILYKYPSIRTAELAYGLGRNYLYSATYGKTRPAIINGLQFTIKE